MDRKSIIGFALIGLILFAFSWYNTRQFNKQQEERRVRDSIDRAEAFKAAAEAYPDADSVELARMLNEGELAGSSDSSAVETSFYKSEYLNAAAADSAGSIVYLENDKVKVGISTKGAQVAEVLIKDYYKYDSTALYLVDTRRNSSFDIELDAGQYINTMDFNYIVASTTGYSVTMRLYFDDDSFIENIYTLASDDYFVDMDLHFVGMDEYIPRSAYSFTISWAWDVPRLEKGYDNEKNYSSVAFRYSDNDNVKEISMRKDGGSESLAGQAQWVAFKQQFFSSILVAADNFSSGDIGGQTYAENNPDRYLMHDAAVLNVEYGEKNSDFSKSFQFYFVPNHYPVLKSYDMKFDKLIPLGGWLVGSINKYIIIPALHAESHDEWKRRAEELNAVAEKLAHYGMKTGYHCHPGDFQPLDGKRPWDTFMAGASERTVVQLDVGNAMSGGADVVAELSAHPGRCQTIHLKPWSKTKGFEPLIGEDDVPWRQLFDFCAGPGATEWYIIEYECPALPPLEVVEKCLNNTKQLLGC